MAGVVANEGIARNIGANTIATRNIIPVVSAVRPVLPPAATPAEDSTNVVTVELSNGKKSTFNVKNGAAGADGTVGGCAGMIVYNKLVRDKIPEIIRASGKTCTTATLSQADYQQMLDQKLYEELAEYQESKSTEELADLLEVIEATALARGCSWEELLSIKAQKRQNKMRRYAACVLSKKWSN